MDKQKIENILDNFKLKGNVRKHTLNLSLELADFLILSDDELKSISQIKVDAEKQKFDNLIKGIDYLKSNDDFVEYLNIDLASLMKKQEGFKRYRSKMKDIRGGKRKAFQKQRNRLFNFLEIEAKLERTDQVEFVHQLCIAFGFSNFGKQHEELEFYDSKDLNAFKRQEIDRIEKWQEDALFDIASLPS